MIRTLPALVFLGTAVSATNTFRDPASYTAIDGSVTSGTVTPYTVYTIDQPMDHFNNNGDTSSTWKQRILISTEHFNSKNKDAPIFFYSGNEGDIENFYQNSGFVTDTLAKEFGAAVVFAEHRFFGQSWPAGDFESSNNPEVYKYLTIEQAQVDFVNIVNYLKSPGAKDLNRKAYLALGIDKRPVIAVGGSYGGMQAAWLRMKFPQTFHGALASSAPIQFTPEIINPYDFDGAITQAYTNISANCSSFIRKNQVNLNASAKSGKSFKTISTAYNTCEPITTRAEVARLAELVEEAFASYTMVNYPYPSNLVGLLPANPVAATCANYATLNIRRATVTQIWTATAKGL